MTRFALALAFFPALASAQYPGSVPPPPSRLAGWEAVKETEARRILGYLAGPETEGRGTGQPGFQKSAEFMAAEFKRLGLKPMGDDGTYFQSAPFNRWRAEGVTLVGAPQPVPVVLTQAGDVLGKSGPLVIVDPDAQLPNEAKIKGAMVVIDGQLDEKKLRALREMGPAAVFTVVEELGEPTWRVSKTGTPRPARILTGKVARRSLPTLRTATLLTLKGEVKSEKVMVPNVIGYLPPTAPKPTDEVVGIGAHLDHLGNVNGTIYPGADDDASGSTALVLTAAALAADPTPRKRGVVFMAFHGEEMGLFGSAHYADNPKFPHPKMIAEIQMDMVGRDSDGEQNGDPTRVDKAEENRDTIRLVGSKRISTELDEIILRLNRHTMFRFKYDAEDVYTRSDHYNFAKNGVPVAFFFDGFHPDYHQPTDTIDKINFGKVVTTARLAYLVVAELAEREGLLKRDVKDGR